MKHTYLLSTAVLMLSATLAACNQAPQAVTPDLGSNEGQLLRDAQQLVQKSKATAATNVYVIDPVSKEVYKVNFSGLSTQAVSTSDVISISKTSEVTYRQSSTHEAEQSTSENKSVVPQTLGICDAQDGPYYRNRIKAGLLTYDTDVTLPSTVNVAVTGGGAFVYTGFSSADGQQHETGFQWVKTATSTSSQWQLYFRVQGSSSPNTSNQWVNGWYINSLNVPKGGTVHINSQIFNSSGYNYILSAVDYGSTRAIVGIRSDSNVNFNSLVQSNENNIWARKIVSLAYSGKDISGNPTSTWPASDKNSYVYNGRFDNSTYTRQTLKANWPNYGCTYQKDGYTVYYDPNSPTYGDIASVYK